MITHLDEVTEFPLCWPDNKPRTSSRKASPFSATLAKAHQEIGEEMRRWRAVGFVVSMAPAYRRSNSDPGCALWWTMRGKEATPNELFVIACDNYHLQEANLHAIAKTLEYLRGCERYGTYTMRQAAEGARLALPAPEVEMLDWKLIFKAPPVASGLAKGDILDIVNARYRRMAAEANGDQDEIRRLNLAIEAARKELAA